MKLYFNKTFGEYVCAGNGVAAMDANKANAIKMALGMVDKDREQNNNHIYSPFDGEEMVAKAMGIPSLKSLFGAYDKHVEMEENKGMDEESECRKCGKKVEEGNLCNYCV